MSKVDRVLRVFGAFVLVTLFYTGTVLGTSGVIGLLFATVLLGTAIPGNCPLYTLLGISTCSRKP